MPSSVQFIFGASAVMVDDNISIAVEDKYAIFKVHKPSGMLMDGIVEQLIQSFEPLNKQYRPILDLQDLDDVTSDVWEFVEHWKDAGALVVADESQKEIIENWPRRLGEVAVIKNARSWSFTQVSMAHLRTEDEILLYNLQDEVQKIVEMAGRAPPTEEEWFYASQDPAIKDIFGNFDQFRMHFATTAQNSKYVFDNIASPAIVGPRYLKRLFTELGRQSSTVQLGLFFNNGSADVSAFHSNAIFNVDTNLGALPFKPSIAATQTQKLFQPELQQFSNMISDPNVQERHFQKFFERNDKFLKFLGYRQISAQVVLERDNASNLRPDFMALPTTGDFWDIIDIKLPQAGGQDRMRFTHDVADLCAQLREYSAYFEDPRCRERVKQRYGIESYRPRLIGIIGNKPQVDPLQARRLHSEVNCEILTFDSLFNLACKSLLI